MLNLDIKSAGVIKYMAVKTIISSEMDSIPQNVADSFEDQDNE